MIITPPEYITKEEYEKREAKLREEYNEKLLKLRKQIQEQRAREEERDKLKDRLWTERIVYITIIIGAVSILTTIIVMIM
ncbi:hypothetical protein CW713_05805 [Methanophagales archaeon]|nr:MAG: hypothetical protein CW714_09030 [Methanophagales archaeon]RJS81895.1 MAG: hypothetical protein CW713_05805 [Methanophagales archaeon]